MARLTGQAAAAERREAYVRGHQLAEMRQAAGLTQAQLAEALAVSQASVSKIEHGDISGIDVVNAYVAALGGTRRRRNRPSTTAAGRSPERAHERGRQRTSEAASA